MAMIGMDIQGVRALAARMTTTASEINSTVTTLTARVDAAEWRGSDREHFIGHWSGTAVPNLRNVAAALESAAGHLLREAQQQETTSLQ